MRRIAILISLLVAAIATLAVRPAVAENVGEAQVFQLLNGARTSVGLPPLGLASDLTEMARQRAADMAAQRRIFHTSVAGIDGKRVGENVGVAKSVEVVHQMFLDSAPHRVNILGDYSEVGIGVVWVDGYAYVAQLFRLPFPANVQPAADEPATPSAESEADPPDAPVAAGEPSARLTEPAPVATVPVDTTPPVPTTTPPEVTPTASIAHIATGAAAVGRPDVARGPLAVALLLINALLAAHAVVELRNRRRLAA